MLPDLALGIAFMILTVVVHSGAMILVMRGLPGRSNKSGPLTRWDEIGEVSAAVLIMFFATLIEVAIWAIGYLALGAIEAREAAVYFSMVTYTTLGYGDITLNEHWRLLSSIEAANGIIMFGWTTAVVIAVVQRLYQRRQPQ